MPAPDGPQFEPEDKPQTLVERATALSAAMKWFPKRQRKMHPSSMQAILGLGSAVTISMEHGIMSILDTSREVKEAGSMLRSEIKGIKPTRKTPFPPAGYEYYPSGDPRELLEKERYVRETPPAMVQYHDQWTPVSQHYKRLQWDPTGSVFMGNPTLSEQMRGAYRDRPDSPHFDPLYAGTPPWHKPPSGDNPLPQRLEPPEMPDRWPYGNET